MIPAKMRGGISPLIKSAVFVLVTLVATMLLAASITGGSRGERTSYNAVFRDVAGLYPGHTVRIAGVRVGQVKKIKLVDRRLAKVEFSVDAGRVLPVSTTASIKYLNLVGGRYVDLQQGTAEPGQSPGDRLRRNGTIPVAQTRGPLNLNMLFQGFQPLMQALSPGDVNKLSESIIKVLQGESGTLESLLQTVGSLTSTLAGKDQLIGQLIRNLNGVTQTINARDTQLVDLLTTLRKFTSGLAADRQPIGEAVVGLGRLSNSIADLLHDSRRPLKDSIHELGRVADQLNEDAPLVERFLQRTPEKLTTLGRLASYGSWLNFYRCEVKVIGVHYNDGRPPPTGIPIEDDRCKG